MSKASPKYLAKLENLIAETEYTIRYAKGNFRSGFCVIKNQKLILVNAFIDIEGKVLALKQILKEIGLPSEGLTPENEKLVAELVREQA